MPKPLTALGSRAAIDQALSRLARKGELMWVCQGVYVRPIQTRFGPRPPAVKKVIVSLSTLWGETIVPCGGEAANALALTTQAPVRSVYLTFGLNRWLTLGELTVDLRHAPVGSWRRHTGWPARQSCPVLAGSRETNLDMIGRKLSTEDLQELAESRAVMSSWIAESMSAMVGNG